MDRPLWRGSLLALISGALCILALPPYDAWPVLFIGFPVLIWLMDGAFSRCGIGARIWRSGLFGFLFGLGFFLCGLHWVGEAFLVDAERYAALMPFAIVGLCAFISLYPAFACAVAAWLWSPAASRIIWFAAVFAGIEWLRGHLLTGFPWNAMGYAAASSHAFLQGAAFVGLYGLTFAAVLFACVPALLVSPSLDGTERLRWRITPILTAAVFLALAWAGGNMRLMNASDTKQPGVYLRIVQPSIPQKMKWSAGQALDIFEHFMTLSGRENLDKVTHVIWPEAAMPFFLDGNMPVLARFASLLPDDAFLITGAMREEKSSNGEKLYFNSVQVFDGQGRKVSQYDKFHLVPFGEYLPLRSFLTSLGLQAFTENQGTFAAGNALRTLSIPRTPAFGPLVCYEIIFPNQVARDDIRPAWLVNVTNDAWFGDSLGPRQHLAQARMRAAEEGLPVIRAANTGISAVIDPQGRVLESLGINVIGVIDAALPAPRPATFYARYGDLPFWLAIALGAALHILLMLRRRRTCT